MKAQSSKLKAQNYNLKLKTLLFSIFIITGYCSYAETISSKELIENAKALDGKTITYKGEIVTAILNRGEGSWMNLNDGDNAIGVWCKNSNLPPIKFIGDYKHKGDVLEVEGIFNRACPLHGGELDIHVEMVKIVKSGYAIEEKMARVKRDIAIALFLVSLSMTIVFRRRI